MWLSVLAENACKGIGKLGELALGRKFREKAYRDALMQAQGRRDAKAIEDGELVFTDEKLIPATLLQNTPQVTMIPLISGMEVEAHNLHANLAIAADVLKGTPDDQVSDEPVNPDWFARWRREAQIIGNEEMRQIWGRILAEEIKKPRTFSYKTLDVLKNITPQDADIFCRMASFNINFLIFENVDGKLPYSLDEIIRMQFLDLVNAGSDFHPFARKTGWDNSFFLRGHNIAFTINIENENITLHTLSLKGWTISIAGREILNIPGAVPPLSSDETQLLGDIIWADLPLSCIKMAAHPLLPSNEAQLDQYLAIWHR